VSATPATIGVPLARRRTKAFPRWVVPAIALSVIAPLILAYVGSNVWTSVHQRGLERRFDAASATWEKLDPVERSSLTYAAGYPIARLVIPSIGLDSIVVEGATPSLMRSGPGHLDASATPGENGVAIITANRLGFGSFFMRLDRLAVGDRIVTESAIGRTVYEVESVKVVPVDEMDLSVESTARVLVLFGSASLWGGPDRIVIRALAAEGSPA
jgi:sortase A